MFKVKLLTNNKRENWKRYFTDDNFIYGNCKYIFDKECNDYDWLVVYEGLMDNELLQCNNKNTIFITTEPVVMKEYSQHIVNQYEHLITSQSLLDLKHHNRHYQMPCLKWFYGTSCNSIIETLTIKNMKNKKDRIAAIYSNVDRNNRTLHKIKFQFLEALKEKIPVIDTYGYGIKKIDDKKQILDEYKYSIVIENFISKHHITEKITDAFLGYTLPFYIGALNIEQYFDPRSFINLELNNIFNSVKIIKETIDNDLFKDRLEYINLSRNKIINKLNLFAMLGEIINNNILEDKPSIKNTVIYKR